MNVKKKQILVETKFMPQGFKIEDKIEYQK
jgi:hypothetical protein